MDIVSFFNYDLEHLSTVKAESDFNYGDLISKCEHRSGNFDKDGEGFTQVILNATYVLGKYNVYKGVAFYYVLPSFWNIESAIYQSDLSVANQKIIDLCNDIVTSTYPTTVKSKELK